MTDLSVSQVLASANAAVVSASPDVAGALSRLLTGVTRVLPAAAAALLVSVDGSLEVLAASSHRAEELDIHQAQTAEGPCVDCLTAGEPVGESGAEALVARWPTLGPQIVAAGYTTVHAVPLRWHGKVFGALNVFETGTGEVPWHARAEAEALADAATLLVLAGGVDGGGLAASLRRALAARAVVEQAKGALAHRRSLGMAEAFEALARLAEHEDVSLGQAARLVMTRAADGTLR